MAWKKFPVMPLTPFTHRMRSGGRKSLQVSLTSCWLGDEIWRDCVAENHWCVTHILLLGGQTTWRTPESHCIVTYSLFIMQQGDYLKKINALWLTNYWSWLDKTSQQRSLQCCSPSVCQTTRCIEATWQKSLNITHKLFLMCFPDRKLLQCHSHPVVQGMRCDETIWQKQLQCDSQAIGHEIRYDETAWWNIAAVPLTICWLMRCDETV